MDHSEVRKRWILWSAKEATYKAARRESLDSIFSPARFVVDLDRSLCGSVRYGNRRWAVRVQIDGDCVHAVVSEHESFVGILSGTCRLASNELRDPSERARHFALSSIAAEWGVAISDLRIEKVGRIPQLILAGKAAPVELSLSHHGAYVGFACRDPRIENADWNSQRAATRKATCGSPSRDASYANTACRSHVEQDVLR
jgi:hypothetical protein